MNTNRRHVTIASRDVLHRVSTSIPVIAGAFLLILLTAVIPFAWAVESVERPNILWLIGENLGPDLECYGTEQVATPNLDGLAAKGVRYTKAFSTAPACSPSRSAFMTGMYQTTIDAHHMRCHNTSYSSSFGVQRTSPLDDGQLLPEGVRLLTHRLRDAGYYTANVRFFGDRRLGTGKEHFNFNLSERPFDSDRWEDLKSHQPFYAQVNFPNVERGLNNPHMWKDYDTLPRIADPNKVRIPPYYPDHPITREDWANYLNSVSKLDRDVGYVLEQLQADGLADNTVVIFFGDNGHLEARGLSWCYDSGLHVPLIVHWPEACSPPPQYRPGSVSDQLVSLLDLTATTLEIAGIRRPDVMQSRAFLGEHADAPRKYVIGARDRHDEVVQHIRTVRTARYRYIRNFRPERPFLFYHRYKEKVYPVMALMRQLHAKGRLTPVQEVSMAPRLPREELYDLSEDPYEIQNLAESKNPEHQQVKRELAAVLDI